MSKKLLPPYKKQSSLSGDRAYVILNEKRTYLGKYDSPESRERYRRELAEWQTRGCVPAVSPDALTIAQLGARYLIYAETYYVKADGTQTSEISNFKQVFAVLVQHYGETRAIQFGPLALMSLRERMIEKGWVRTSINKQVGRLKVMFRWAVSRELIPPNVHQALCAVPGLKRGRCKAKESDPVRPVAETDVERIRPYVSRQVWAMIQLQLLSGARSGEIVILRPCDVDRSGKVWIYRPSTHKTEHHNRERVIYFGPRAQQELQPFLRTKASRTLFSQRTRRNGNGGRKYTLLGKRREHGRCQLSHHPDGSTLLRYRSGPPPP